MQFSLDIETLSTRHDAAIVSIGCVAFNSDGIHGTFYEVVHLDTEAHVDEDTLAWWARQPRGALIEVVQSFTSLGIAEVMRNVGVHREHALAKLLVKRSIEEVLLSFEQWIILKAEAGNGGVWACSPSFDCVILKSAYAREDLNAPWPYWMERDLRTLRVCTPQLERQNFHGEDEIKNHALHDALAQAREIMERAALLNLKLS